MNPEHTNSFQRTDEIAQQVGELLDEYLLANENGQQVSPEDICKGMPELLAPLRREIERHRRFESLKHAHDPPLPTVYGSYRVVSRLGVGGCGTVFLCQHQHLKREAAVKVIVLSRNERLAEAHFQREIEVVRSFNHDRIATIYDSGTLMHGEFTLGWLAMEYLPEGRIDDYLSARDSSVEEVLSTFRSVVATLVDAHQAGILHHDIKPGNVLMSADGKPHLTDFGLARIGAEQDSEFQAAVAPGTPAYMAPELRNGTGKPGVTSDIYSLGILLTTLLVRRSPSEWRGNEGVMSAVRYLRTARADCSHDLEAVVSRMTAEVPGDRYPSLPELLTDIDCLMTGAPVEARPLSTVERVYRWSCRNPAMTSLGTVALIAVAVVIWQFVQKIAERHEHAQIVESQNSQLVRSNAQLQRTVVNSRLTAVQAVMKTDRMLAVQQLEDVSLFPPDQRRFSWHFLHGEASDLSTDLSHSGTGFGRIYQVKFTPDGEKLIVGSKPGLISIVDIASHDRLHVAEDMQIIGTVLFRPGRQSFYCRKLSGEMLEASWETGDIVHRFTLPETCRPKTVITSAGDAILGLTKDGRPFRIHLESEAWLTGDSSINGVPASLWLSPDDRELHCVSRNAVWHVWRVDDLSLSMKEDLRSQINPEQGTRLPLEEIPPVRAANMSYDTYFGRCMVLSFNNRVATTLWPDADRPFPIFAKVSLVASHLPFHGRSQCVIPDGKGGRLISLFDSKDQIILAPRSDHVIAVDISKDGRVVATGGATGALRVIRIADSAGRVAQVHSFRGKDRGYGPPVQAIRLPGERLLVCHREGWVAVIDTNTRLVQEAFRIRDDVFRSATYLQSKKLVVLGMSQPKGKLIGLRVLSNGTFLPTSASSAVDTSAGATTPVQSAPEPVFDIDCNSDVLTMCPDLKQDTLLVGLRDGRLVVVNISAGKIDRTLRGVDPTDYYTAMIPFGEFILCGRKGGLIEVVDVENNASVRSWQADDTKITSLAVSPDNRRIYSGAESGDIKVWNAEGELLDQLLGHRGSVLTLALSSDGQTLASGGADFNIVTWDAETGETQLLLEKHVDEVTGLWFSKDDSELWSISEDHGIFKWTADFRMPVKTQPMSD